MYTIYPLDSKTAFREKGKLIKFQNIFDVYMFCSSHKIYKFKVKLGGRFLPDLFELTPKEK